MKKVLLYAIIILFSFDLNGQIETYTISDSTTIIEPGERLQLFTDRSIYCVNENILFTVDYDFMGGADSLMWSQVLYAELIRWNGSKLADMKLHLTKSGASGKIRIPGDLYSGNYYLRVYTKWMRNFSPDIFTYRLVKIVNPFNATIDAGPSDKIDTLFYPNQESSNVADPDISCVLNKTTYQAGEKAEVEIYINKDGSIDDGKYCISIAKAGTIDSSLFFRPSQSDSHVVKWGAIRYLPEISGITISGEVFHKETRSPMKNQIVRLSEIKNGQYFSQYKTNDKGLFFFSLPYLYGKYDFFIQSEDSDSAISDILIDDGFCNRPVLLPYVPFKIHENEKPLLKDMIVNMQLQEKFYPDTANNSVVSDHRPIAFYGSAFHRYDAQKYIELPNIEEFFIEIVNETYVTHNNGKTELKISGTSGFSNYPVLVFLDNIPIDADERLFKLRMDRIESVDVIENGYAIGDMKFSGLISIHSKEKDLAGINLNKNSRFFTYDLLSKENDNSQSYRDENPRIPDRRNLLYWNPDIQIASGKKTTLSFYTSDDKGDFAVYIFRKNNKENRVLYGKATFSVK